MSYTIPLDWGQRMLVVGDIGGTKTAMALYALDDDVRSPRFRQDFPSADYPDLDTIVRTFITASGERADYGCFDVAGPVVQGRATITKRLSAALQRIPVHVVTVPAALFGAAQFGIDAVRVP